MVSQFGDVVPSPGLYAGSPSDGQPDILYSQSGAEFHGGTLEPGQGVLRWGTAVEFDAATSRYKRATAADKVVGFLRYGVDTGSADSHPRQGLFVMGGVLKAGYLQVNNAALANAAAKKALAEALGGSYNNANDSVRF